MLSRELNSQHQKLKYLISISRIASDHNAEHQGHWAKYICVLTAGFIENSVKTVYSEYARKAAPPAIAKYVQAQLNKVQNPKPSRFLEIAAAFKSEWKDDLDGFLTDNGRKDAVEAVMNNRHLIAHGKNTEISMISIEEYLKKSVEVINYIERQCGLSVSY